MVKSLPTNANAQVRDAGLIPGSGRSSEEGNGILAWKIPWTEEPGRLQSIGHEELDTTE